MPDPTEYVRVTDLDTGHKSTVTRGQLAHGNYRELKADPLDVAGVPLPPEFNAVEPTTSGQSADTKKES